MGYALHGPHSAIRPAISEASCNMLACWQHMQSFSWKPHGKFLQSCAMPRQQLKFAALETVDIEVVDQPGLRATQAMKLAAKRWARSQPNTRIGDYRSMRQTAVGWETVGRCLRCNSCQKHWRFRFSVCEDKWQMQIEVANDCKNEPTKARRSQKVEKQQPTVEERQLVLEACDSLAEQGLPVTGKSVQLMLRFRMNAETLRAIIRHRRKTLGKTTSKFLESIEDFQSHAKQYTDTDKALQFCQINAGPQVFSWIAFVCPFLDRLQHLHTLHNFTYWACTTDFTTRVCHLEYQVGFLSAITFKQQRNTWLKGALPLLALCAPQERKEIYRPVIPITSVTR